MTLTSVSDLEGLVYKLLLFTWHHARMSDWHTLLDLTTFVLGFRGLGPSKVCQSDMRA